jgi:DNA-damage-inducible protein D
LVLLGYSKWDNFQNVLEKAKSACELAGENRLDHFPEVRKMVPIGSGVEREIEDIALTRYACYLVAQNADSRKQQVAFAQTYFAVQTRKQELVEQRLAENERLQARAKLKETEKNLSGVLYERGVDSKGFALIRSKGDQKLFGGLTTDQMKRKYKVPENRPLADFLPTLTIKAKDFAAELTNHNVQAKNLHGVPAITREHEDNNSEVRKMLAKRGVSPENLPPAEDMNKVERRLESEKKKALSPKKTQKKSK